MPKRRQRSSHQPVPSNGYRCSAAKAPSRCGGYTQKEYLPREERRLLELVGQHGNDWKTIVRQYNADFGDRGRKRTAEGLKNKYGRDLKPKTRKEAQKEMTGFLAGSDNFTMHGWGEASIASSHAPQPAAEVQQMSAFESAPDTGGGIVDLAAQMPMSYVEQTLDGVYADCSASGFSSSPLNLPSTPCAFTAVAGPGHGLEWLDSVWSGWSANDFPSLPTEFRASPMDPVWPSTFANGLALGGGLDSFFVGSCPDDIAFFPPDLCLMPDVLASTAELGGLMTYDSLSAWYNGEGNQVWDVPCHFGAL